MFQINSTNFAVQLDDNFCLGTALNNRNRNVSTNMYRFYVIGLLAFGAFIANTNAESISLCEGVADNVFLTDITNCSNYYICAKGQAVAQQCRNGWYFNEDSQSCVASDSNCLKCNKNVLTSIGLNKTCNKYVLCFAGYPVLQKCADELHFNKNLRVCDLPSNVDCVANHCSIHQNPNDIIYVASQAKCDRYFICMNGQPINQTCISGLHFNSVSNSCDWPTKTNCSISVPQSAQRSIQTADTLAPRMVDIKCPTDGIHFLAHSKVNQYFMCVNGKGALMTCAASLYFDKERGVCRRQEDILKDH